MASDSHNIEEGIHSCDQKPFEDVCSVGLAIRRFPHGNHAGVLYQSQSAIPGNSFQEIKMLHLALPREDDALQCDNPTPEYLWVQPNLPSLILRNVAAYCRRIWTRVDTHGNDYGYGFSAPYCTLQNDGSPRPSATGLTCATFALAVFSFSGIRLVQADSWPPTNNNLLWQTHFVHRYLHGCPEFLEKIKKEITGVRFTPAEVIGSALSFSGNPITYSEAILLAELVDNRLNAHYQDSNV